MKSTRTCPKTWPTTLPPPINMRSLISVVCAITLVSSSRASVAPSIGDDGRSSATKPPGEMLVAQAWWTAAENAAAAQQARPLVRSETRRYRRSFRGAAAVSKQPRRP